MLNKSIVGFLLLSASFQDADSKPLRKPHRPYFGTATEAATKEHEMQHFDGSLGAELGATTQELNMEQAEADFLKRYRTFGLGDIGHVLDVAEHTMGHTAIDAASTVSHPMADLDAINHASGHGPDPTGPLFKHAQDLAKKAESNAVKSVEETPEAVVDGEAPIPEEVRRRLINDIIAGDYSLNVQQIEQLLQRYRYNRMLGWDSIKNAVKPITDKVQDAAQTANDAGNDVLHHIKGNDAEHDAAEIVGDDASHVAESDGAKVAETLAADGAKVAADSRRRLSLWNDIKNAVKAAEDKVEDAVHSATDAEKEVVHNDQEKEAMNAEEKMADDARRRLGGYLNPFNRMAKLPTNPESDANNKEMDALRFGWLDDIVDVVGDVADDIISEPVGNIIDEIISGSVSVIDAINSNEISVEDAVSDGLLSVLDAINDNLLSVTDAVHDGLLFGDIDVIEGIIDGTLDIYDAIKDNLISVEDAINDHLISAVNAVKEELLSVPEAINGGYATSLELVISGDLSITDALIKNYLTFKEIIDNLSLIQQSVF